MQNARANAKGIKSTQGHGTLLAGFRGVRGRKDGRRDQDEAKDVHKRDSSMAGKGVERGSDNVAQTDEGEGERRRGERATVRNSS